MLTEITIGQFFPANSFLHRLDPRNKICLLIILMIAIFFLDTPLLYATMTGFVLLLALSSKVPLGFYFKSLKPLFWMLAFTFLIHLFSANGKEIFRLWIFSATQEGLFNGLFLCLRLILLILCSAILTFTTSPLDLTDALEKLLTPLKIIGLPAHDIAMMMTIALRFIPTLLEETDKIIKAQQSRGLDLSAGNFVKRFMHFMPILVPLFIASFRRADALAMAMEARCYHGGEGRTRLKILQITQKDYVAAFVIVLFVALLFFEKFYKEIL